MKVIQETTQFNPIEVKVLVETQEEYNDLIGYIKNYGPKLVSSGNQPDSDGWISNEGNDFCIWPDGCGIEAYTWVEIERRNGVTEKRNAGKWLESWKETDGCDIDIIKFRIVK